MNSKVLDILSDTSIFRIVFLVQFPTIVFVLLLVKQFQKIKKNKHITPLHVT